MSYLTIDRQDNIAVVTLDQEGEKVNKLNETLIEEFSGLMDDFEEDGTLEGIVLKEALRPRDILTDETIVDFYERHF